MNEANREIKFLTAKQVSEYLQIPLRTVHRLSKKGKIKAFKVGGQWRYLYEDIKKYGNGFFKDKKEEFLTAKEVSEYLHIHLRTVHRLSKQGKIKTTKIGGQWRYLKSDIENYNLNSTDFSIAAERVPQVQKTHEFIERRSCPRINTNFNCKYSVDLRPFKRIQSEGMIKNLSGGGVFLVNDSSAIDVGDPIHLSFMLDTGQGISAKGKVMRKEEYGVGIKFKDIDKEIQNRIISYAS